jgi:hypothetical protein
MKECSFGHLSVSSFSLGISFTSEHVGQVNGAADRDKRQSSTDSSLNTFTVEDGCLLGCSAV